MIYYNECVLIRLINVGYIIDSQQYNHRNDDLNFSWLLLLR